MAENIATDLLGKTIATLAGRRFPESTYRLQFNAGFTFKDATRVVPYLNALGVTHCYASPYLKARPGSLHGYDITDHHLLNPEIGTNEDHAAWVEALAAHGMSHIVDTVPNHMGILGNDNLWWNDILENGPSSPYAGFFDIDWQSSPRPQLQSKVLLPVLGAPYGEVLESQQIRLTFSAGAFFLQYFDHRFPVTPDSYDAILGHRLKALEERLEPTSADFMEYQSILTAVSHLPPCTETSAASVAQRLREKEVVKRRLQALVERVAPIAAFIEENIALFNGVKGDPASFDALDHLLERQPYRLAYWRVAADEINYRRFFDINDLAALSMERPDVFQETHELLLELTQSGKVAGLRIDHPDGLYDPRQYLDRLQEQYLLTCARALFKTLPAYQGLEWKDHEAAVSSALHGARRSTAAQGGLDPELLWRPLFVVVEKILGANEELPSDWPVHGTTGYDFLNLVNGLFVDTGNAHPFTRLYRDFAGFEVPFSEVAYQNKSLTLRTALSSELHMLAHQLDRLAQQDRRSRDFTLTTLRHALREVIACFPVYRSYIGDSGVSDTDRKYVETALRRAAARNPVYNPSLFEFVRSILLLEYAPQANAAAQAEQRRFVGKFQQVTAPVMAKGLEDTAFYVYNRLLSLNEVGGDPARFGIIPEVLHRAMQNRHDRWPWSLSPLSTHDSKRSEDVRARLNVLSEIPARWRARVERWARLNATHLVTVEDGSVPDANEEYLLYQTLLGAWPLEPYTAEDYAQFVRRIQDYMNKVLHEAKVHSSWLNPNEAYDKAMRTFVGRILDPRQSKPFLDELRPFRQRIAHMGLLNSLAQTLLRLTLPGVPDTYQGTELWDFSLVDPDNRRPVNYELRQQMLEALKRDAAAPDRRPLLRSLLQTIADGRIKLFVTWQGLSCRRDLAGLFSVGDYVPLEVVGPAADHAFAFRRRHGDNQAVVVVPRLLTRLLPEAPSLPLGEAIWQDTCLKLPDEQDQPFHNVFTGERHQPAHDGEVATLRLSSIFGEFPVALLLGDRRPAAK
jgi:(1->4)-alpha-D-glucan 1-alpha-D-glucosylmutase